MKVILIGYGKMGKAVEQVLLANGHEIVAKIGSTNLSDLSPENARRADVAIEFSRPELAVGHIRFCLENGLPVVSGTTGWLDKLLEMNDLCKENNGAFFYASNFSIGVNLFFALNKYLARQLDRHPAYQPSMEEIHHTQKLDYPSGTAITLAEGLLAENHAKQNWAAKLEGTEASTRSIPAESLLITSKRVENVPGTHRICWDSPVDSIEIKHTAHSRVGFASGAAMAASWLIGKKGVFGMDDMLGIGKGGLF